MENTIYTGVASRSHVQKIKKTNSNTSHVEQPEG